MKRLNNPDVIRAALGLMSSFPPSPEFALVCFLVIILTYFL